MTLPIILAGITIGVTLAGLVAGVVKCRRLAGLREREAGDVDAGNLVSPHGPLGAREPSALSSRSLSIGHGGEERLTLDLLGDVGRKTRGRA
jgi:hypothetical protein